VNVILVLMQSTLRLHAWLARAKRNKAPQGSLTWFDFCGDHQLHTITLNSYATNSGYGSLIGASVASDGSIFQTWASANISYTSPNFDCAALLDSINITLYLYRTAPDGSVIFVPFHTDTSPIPSNDPNQAVYRNPTCSQCLPIGETPAYQQFPYDITFRLVPDGRGGAFVPWWKALGAFASFEAHVSHVSPSGVTDLVLPLDYQNTVLASSDACPSPYFRPGLRCMADLRLVLAEDHPG